MKTFVIAAIAAVAFAVPTAASAAEVAPPAAAGHYKWVATPQYGPRSSVPALKRVWVADRVETASANSAPCADDSCCDDPTCTDPACCDEHGANRAQGAAA
jgi:hypothetical protein